MHVKDVKLGGLLVPGREDMPPERETLRGMGGDVLPRPSTNRVRSKRRSYKARLFQYLNHLRRSDNEGCRGKMPDVACDRERFVDAHLHFIENDVIRVGEMHVCDFRPLCIQSKIPECTDDGFHLRSTERELGPGKDFPVFHEDVFVLQRGNSPVEYCLDGQLPDVRFRLPRTWRTRRRSCR